MNKNKPVNTPAICRLILILHQGEWSKEELVDKSGLGETAIGTWLKYLRERKLVIISDRIRTHQRGREKYIYSWNHNLEGEDCKLIPKRTNAEHCKDYYSRKKLKNLLGVSNGSL